MQGRAGGGAGVSEATSHRSCAGEVAVSSPKASAQEQRQERWKTARYGKEETRVSRKSILKATSPVR